MWPVWGTSLDLVGWIGRDLDGISDRKYYNMPGMKVLSTLWPWPASITKDSTSIVLVEGITDALRLLQAGIPALATLGTAWSSLRTTLLQILGVENIVLAYDNDDAGYIANEQIALELSKSFSSDSISKWEWPDKNDPGDAPWSEVLSLRNHLNLKKGVHPWLQATPPLQQHWFLNPS